MDNSLIFFDKFVTGIYCVFTVEWVTLWEPRLQRLSVNGSMH